jgi:hypothetical protein
MELVGKKLNERERERLIKQIKQFQKNGGMML